MSDWPKKGCPEEELNRQYREAMDSLTEKNKRELIDYAGRQMRKDCLWSSRENPASGCGCVLWFSFLMLIGFTGAACMSWIFNHSMPMAFLHGIFGWLYICYKSFWFVVTNF